MILSFQGKSTRKRQRYSNAAALCLSIFIYGDEMIYRTTGILKV
jgi:hypothetical protein